MSIVATDVSNLFKRIYKLTPVENIVVRDHKLLQWVTRDKGFTSRQMDVPITVANNQRVGADFEMAKSGSSSGGTVYKQANITQRNLYGFAQLAGRDITNFQQGGNESYFYDGVKREFDSLLEGMGADAGLQIYRNGTGIIGRLSAGTASPVTFADATSVSYCYVGMAIQASPNGDGSSPRSGTGVITKVDFDNAQVTYTGTITSLAATDYIFNANNLTATTGQGLDAWNPLTPVASFNGLDQTIDTVRLSGVRYNCSNDGGTAYPLEVGIPRAVQKHYQATSKRVDAVFMNPMDFDKLSQAKAGQLVRSEVSSDKAYNLAIEAFTVGSVTVIPDPDCPEGVARGVRKDSFKWMTAGPCPIVDQRDGLKLRLAQTGDNFDIQAFGYHNFASPYPAGLLRIALQTG